METVDVVVLGGGPTGMTVAGDLARAGRSVTVLERWTSINPSSRAFATMARTLEVLDARGLADGLLELGEHAQRVNLFRGAELNLTRIPSRYPFVLITPQTNVDQALGRYAEDRGATVRRGVEVVGLVQDDQGVSVTARPKEGGEEIQYRAGYAVGADGSHSTVRELLGAEFPGRAVLSSIVLADVKLSAGPTGGGLTLGNVSGAFSFLVPYGREDTDGAWYRSMTWDSAHQVPDSTPVGDGEIEAVLSRTTKHDLGLVEIGWHSRFHCDERQVGSYRAGRVFLAGDAAHVHSPMGGQGMNTAIQDAANLSWKLDAVLGGADDAVLDTYQSERHPIGRRVLFQSGAMLRAVTLKPPVARWLRDHIAPLVLGLAPVSDVIAGSFTGTTLRYKAGRGEHRLVGTRAEQVPLRDTTLADQLRAPGFVLVREQGAPVVDAPVTGLAQVERTDSGPALLVRPDGYVAWAGPTVAASGWPDVLARWTGSRSLRT